MHEEFLLARPDETEEVLNVLFGRVEWFKKNQIEQWDEAYIESKRGELTEFVHQHKCYVIKQDEKIVSVCILLDSCDKWHGHEGSKYIHILASAAKGAGRRMIEYIKEICLEQGIKFLRLDCQDHNEVLKKYYLRLGFVPKGRIPHKYFPNRYSCLFELELFLK